MGHPALHPDRLTFGERSADAVKRGLGSWKFIWIQTGIVVVWIALNLFAVAFRWDPYPFILLNLAFSTQAAYSAPILQLSNNRSDKITAELAQHDYEVNQKSLELLKEIIERLEGPNS